MSEVSLFGEGNSLVSSDLFKQLQEIDDNLDSGGGGGGGNRISIRGGRFRQIVDGEEVNVKTDGQLNLVIINAAKLSRTYYAGVYESANPTAPACWSVDTQVPSGDVPADTRQASRCMDCPQNIKGSGQGDSRACRYNQRLAVMLEGEYDTVYQLQLPATSIFGEAKDGKMGMQAFAKHLKAHNTPSIAILTQAYFDESCATPKLFFKAVRPLDEEDLKQAVSMKDSDGATKAITWTVSQTDNVETQRGGAVAKEEFVLDDAPEPKKVAKKKEVSAPPPNEADLSSIVDDWDD
jgi:hypothetical protein